MAETPPSRAPGDPGAMAGGPGRSKHDHDHDHAHHGHPHGGHGHGERGELLHLPHASYGKLKVSFFAVTAFMLVETACGWAFNSLALLSDGFHMLSDAVALGVACYAVALGRRRATEAKTFGFRRFEVLAAFGNGLSLLVVSAFIALGALGRLVHPEPVRAWSMLWVASAGFAINLFVAWWLHRGEGGEGHSLNVQSVLLHVLGDLAGSAAAMAAAAGILLRGWLWLDPALSLAISVLISVGGIRVLRRSAHILVEGTPEGVEVRALRASMLGTGQVTGVHDLHVWTMDGRDLWLSAHVEVGPGSLDEKAVVAALSRRLGDEHGVDHITLQVGPCGAGGCGEHCGQ